MNAINKPTHPRRAFDNPGKPPQWWGGPNHFKVKKFRGGTKHKLGTRKGEMVRDTGSR